MLQQHPGKFVGCLLADPRPGSTGVLMIEQLAAAGYRAVRFNPYLWPEGEKMNNEVPPRKGKEPLVCIAQRSRATAQQGQSRSREAAEREHAWDMRVD